MSTFIKTALVIFLLPDCLFGGSVLMITNEVVGGDHRDDLLVVPHVDRVDVGVAVEATGDEVDGDVLHLASSLFDGSVLGCGVDGHFVTFLFVWTFCFILNHFFRTYSRVG
jgi:hypothetical protein